MSRRRLMKVVYVCDGHSLDLGALPGGFLHASSLDPFVSRLLQDGYREGVIVLLDEDTGETVTKRSLQPVNSGATQLKSG